MGRDGKIASFQKGMKVKTRVAPSPTGAPHVGTAYAALFSYAFAKKYHGKFVLRIEDTDQTRLVKGAEQQILDALEWLGLRWDEGPFKQSKRLPLYKKYAEELVEKGAAYYCFCSEARLEDLRKKLQEKGLPPRYDGLCRHLDPREAKERTKKEKYVIRLAAPKEGVTHFNDLIRGEINFENSVLDDQVLLKSDGFPTYHLAVVVDDHLMEITHVLRAEEWISSTPKHLLLYQAFGWEPPVFGHLPVLRETDRSKLSKRHGSVGVLEFREEGYLPEALLNFLALLGWSHPQGKEIFSLDEFIANLDLSRISPTGPVFDRRKLDWMNGEYIRQSDPKQLGRRLERYLKEYRGLGIDRVLLEKVVPLVRERIKKLSEFEDLAGFFFRDIAWSKEMLIQESETLDSTREKLTATLNLLTCQNVWRAAVLEEEIRRLAEAHSWKAPRLFMLLRLAVTGQIVSPPLFESMEILGKEKTISRLDSAITVLD